MMDRYRGALLGLACGDAVGTTVEFSPPGTFEPVTDMVGGGPFGLQPGQWTDDTSMALCLAESLVECDGFDPVDQLRRYVRWYRDGHLSSTGRCFDIGVATRAALERFERTGERYPGDAAPNAGGNGSLMRLAPVALAYAGDPREAVARAYESSRVTHGTIEAHDACRYFAALLVGALRGAPREELLAPHFMPELWEEQPLCRRIDEIAAGSHARREPPEIRGGGWAVHCLEAALWALGRARDFEHGCLLAVNLGDDADTTAAVYGQIAGAYYGAGGMPERWLQKVVLRERIEELAAGLYALARAPGVGGRRSGAPPRT